MLRIDSSAGKLAALSGRTLRAAPLAEVSDLPALLTADPESLFTEVGLPLRFVSPRIPRPRRAPDPAQMLAADVGGRLYVVAVQVEDKSPELAAALETASIVSRWRLENLESALTKQEINGLREFLKVSPEHVNHGQGVILIAERFSPEGLAVIGWLRRTYDLHLICLGLRRWVDDETGEEFLAVNPAPLSPEGDNGAGVGGPLLLIPPAAPRVEAPPPAHEPLTPSEPDRQSGETVVPAIEEPSSPSLEPESDEPAWIDVTEPSEPQLYEGGAEEDPLAELLADIERMRQEPLPVAPVEEPSDIERRREPRGTNYQARRLRLDYLGRPLGARVVDFSPVGIGVEALSPLPLGATVRISGEIVGAEGAFGLEGPAKVAHCSARPDGVCRIGFALQAENLRKAAAGAQDFDRR